MPSTETKIDLLKVIIANAGGLAITFTNVSEALKIIALVLTIGYTIWKWRKDFLDDRDG